MKARIAFTVLCLVATSAGAQDAAKPGKPPAPATAPAAKKERKTSPEAEAAFAKYVALLHFPSSKYKTLQMGSHCDVQALGGEVACKFTIKDDGSIALDVTLPEAAKQQFGEDQAVQYKRVAAGMVRGIFKPFLVPADVMAKQYDLSARVENGKTVVEMTRFADDAAWDKATLWFDADGLIARQVGTPNVDPDDQMAAMNAGAEIETKFAYKKRGDLYTIESAEIVDPMGASEVTLAYYEIAGSPPLPKELTVTTPMMPEPLVVSIHDFVLDGKPVAGTERKEEKKPAPAAPPKPVEPAKPADAPKPADPPKPAK